ncbi:unnamed protein product, partial [Brenthis ino]
MTLALSRSSKDQVANVRERTVCKYIQGSGKVDECWNEMANYIREIAREVFGETKGKGTIDRDTWWWSEEVQRALKEKRGI